MGSGGREEIGRTLIPEFGPAHAVCVTHLFVGRSSRQSIPSVGAPVYIGAMVTLSRGALALVLVSSCGTAPARPSPPPVLSAPASPAPAVSTSAAPSAPVAASTAAAAVDAPDEEAQNNLAGTVDADGPPAPCDLARSYRGKVGEEALSVVLSRASATLHGSSAYDSGFGEIEISGSAQPDGTLTLAERKDGKDTAVLHGRCASDTGILTGTWTQGSINRPFTLKPREAGGAPLGQRARRIERKAKGSECTWDVRSPAVFGLGDAERTARINGLLKVRFPAANDEEMERRVTTCAPGADNQVQGWYSVEANTRGLLSVVENGYAYLGPMVHGDFGAAEAAISVDVPSGRRLALTDVVTSSKALRPLVKSCMTLLVAKITGDEWWWERELQGVPSDKDGEPAEETAKTFVPSSLREPMILVLPDGIAVLIHNQPTVAAQMALRGPVLRWGALLRAGVLKASSPAARLWAGEKPAAAGEPTCQRVFEPRWVNQLKR